MLVAKELRLAEHFSQAPLTHPTLLKSALFTVVLALVAMMRYLKRADRSRRPSAFDVDASFARV